VNPTTPSEQTRIGRRGLPATVHEISDEDDEESSESEDEEKSESKEESSDAELGKL
jgi:hypothetical protein